MFIIIHQKRAESLPVDAVKVQLLVFLTFLFSIVHKRLKKLKGYKFIDQSHIIHHQIKNT